MGWTNLPATAGTDIQDYQFVSQFWFALRERFQAAGTMYWPESSAPWGDGIVPSGITETSFTDSAANAGHGWSDATYDNPWRGIPGPIDWSPRSAGWYLVIDHCDDPTKVVKTRITSWTATTLHFESINDQIVAGYVTLAELVTRKYFIIRGDWGLWWHERFLEFPNDYEFAAGLVAEHFDDPNDPSLRTNPTDHSLRDTGQQWPTNEHVGRHLLVYAAEDGLLQRVPVAANTADTLTFATQTWTPKVGASYCIVDVNGKAYPGKGPVYPFAWCRGPFDPVAAHFPAADLSGNYLQSTPVPAITVGYPDVGDFGCVTTFGPVFDRDHHLSISPSAEQLACGYWTDKFLTPDFWKSLRALQYGCEAVCGYYVLNTSFDGQKSIPPFVPATMFHAAGINAMMTAISAVDSGGGGASINTPLPYSTPIDLHYAVLDDTGTPYKSGTLTATSPTHLSGPFEDASPPGNSDRDRTLVLSAGWSRSTPREFLRMFDKTCFVPDMVDVPEVAVDPPVVVDFTGSGCAGAGTWLTHAKSTTYVEQGILGPHEGEAFLKNDAARYIGDNWNDPIYAATPLVKHFDHFYTGQFPAAVQAGIDAQRSGAATAGGATYLTDDGQDWWDPKWYEVQANMHVETGTGGNGSSTTSLRDASKAEGESNCWWASSRFPDTAGPYVGFTIEILMSGTGFDDPEAVVEKRLITSGDAGIVSVGWATPLPSTSQGKQYRIREPRGYELNRWKGRKLRMTRPDDSVAETTILGNDDHTLFFTDIGFAPTAGTPYEIIDPAVGTVWQWTGSSWVNPIPDDCTQKVPKTQTVRRYGRFTTGDYLTPTLFNELYHVINTLRRTHHGASWTGRAYPEPNPFDPQPEYNRRAAGDSNIGSLADDRIFEEGLFSGPHAPPAPPYDPRRESNGPPTAYAREYQSSPATNGVSADRVYAYMTGSFPVGPYCKDHPLACSVDWYVYSEIKDEFDGLIHPVGFEPDQFGGGTTYTFDANGDPVAYRRWTLALSTGTSSDQWRQTDQVGSLAHPNWPADPPEPQSAVNGYYITNQVAVALWNFGYVG